MDDFVEDDYDANSDDILLVMYVNIIMKKKMKNFAWEEEILFLRVGCCCLYVH
jgi:hypothetical protein